jgi:hypothetical protein
MDSNKRQRTINERPADAVTATPLVESVASALVFRPTSQNWGDGMKWEKMEHDTRLRFLTPRFSETGRTDKPETAFYDCLPQAVKDPLSNERVAQLKTARDIAIKEVKVFFVRAKEVQEEQEKNERDDNKSSDGYSSQYDLYGMVS